MKKTFCFAALVLGLFLVGCGAGEQALDTKGQEQALNRMQTLRPLWVKAQGKWENLSPEDRKTFVDLSSGSEEVAKRTFEGMSGPPGGGPPNAPGAPTPPGR